MTKRKQQRTQDEPKRDVQPTGEPKAAHEDRSSDDDEAALAEGAKGAARGGILGGGPGAIFGGMLGLFGGGRRSKKDSSW